jgi:hypothetical protein
MRISIGVTLESGSRLVPEALCRKTFCLRLAAGPLICICAVAAVAAQVSTAPHHHLI